MPTTLSSFAAGEATMRYKEPYVTEGLNKKLAVNTPPGTFRGFRLGTSGVALNVTIVADPTFLDHVAVYQTGSGAALSIRKTGGNYAVDLTAYVNKTVVIAIYATYGVGFTTTAVVRAYEFLPTDEFTPAIENAELVVLGTVVVPAAGLIPATDITHDRRRMAWEATAPEAHPWQPLLQNSSFEEVSGGDSGDSLQDVAESWEASITAGSAIWGSGLGTGRTGFANLKLERVGAGVVSGRLLQRVGAPVRPGQLIRVQAFKRSLEASTAGTLRFVLKFWGQDRIANAEVYSTIVSNAVDADYVLAETTVTVPDLTGGIATGYLEFVGIEALTLDWAVVSSEKIRIDDFQTWLEATPNTAAPTIYQSLAANQLFFKGVTGNYGSSQALLRLAASNTLEMKAADPTSGQPILNLHGKAILGTGLLGSESEALQPRITVDARNDIGTTWTQISEHNSAVLGNAARTYVNYLGSICTVVNASYDGTNWTKEVAGQPAIREILYAGVASGDNYYSRQVRWDDTAWNESAWIEFYKSSGPTPTSTGTPEFNPIIEVRDGGGNRKVIVDHLGFVMGRQAEMNETWWRVNPGVAPPLDPRDWVETNLGGGSTFIGPSGIARIDVGATPGNYHSLVTTNDEFIPRDSVVMMVAAEWEWSPNNVNIFLPECKVVMGMFNGGPFNLLASEGVWIGARETDTTWQFASQFFGGGGNYWTDAAGAFGGLVDTGVAVSSLQRRMRIEIHGSHSTYGGGHRALAYINGDLVGEIAGADLPLAALGWGMEIYRFAATGTRSMSIGPLKIRHNRRIRSEDAL